MPIPSSRIIDTIAVGSGVGLYKHLRTRRFLKVIASQILASPVAERGLLTTTADGLQLN